MWQRVATVLLSLLSGLWLVSTDRAMAEDRSPAEILKELDQVKLPTVDYAKLEDDAYGRDLTARRDEAIEKRSALILEFYKAARAREDSCTHVGAMGYPDHTGRIAVENEIHQVLAKSSDAKLKREAAFAR